MSTREIVVTESGLFIPIAKEKEKKTLSFFCRGEKVLELEVPVDMQEETTKNPYRFDYMVHVPFSDCQGEHITISGEVSQEFLEAVSLVETAPSKQERHPKIHFSPDTGWINDPNGLIYDDGVYHLYFQYNPFDTQWENMSWGHGVSTDLLHWKQEETVMYPDEEGTVFSGCAIKNDRKMLGLPEDALLFCYTCAGGTSRWSTGRPVTQKYAYSTDKGKTLNRIKEPVLPMFSRENRDPKIFWHEESNAYIMVLYLDQNAFLILRSQDLTDWKQSQEISFEKAWECPDLFCLQTDEGEKKWVFQTADGFYYLGDFDGYTFETDGIRKESYVTRLPYAAQTYANVEDRIISIAWLRTQNEGKNYTGVMALPKELSLIKRENEYLLCQRPVREYQESRKLVEQVSLEEREVYCYQMSERDVARGICSKQGRPGDIQWNILGNVVEYQPETGMLLFGENKVQILTGLTEFSIIVDGGIYEIIGGNGIIVAVFESDADDGQNRISVVSQEKQNLQIYEVS